LTPELKSVALREIGLLRAAGDDLGQAGCLKPNPLNDGSAALLSAAPFNLTGGTERGGMREIHRG
jgi:hypothetical protein